MKPRNEALRAQVERIVEYKIQTGRRRAPNYAEIAKACNVKPMTLARAVCVELKRRKSTSST